MAHWAALGRSSPGLARITPLSPEHLLDPSVAAERLERGATLVAALFEGLEPAFQRWKSAPERWSLLEILAHLADEEELDFRARIQSTLRDPSAAWPPIAPQDWVAARRYNEQDPGTVLNRFRTERARSVQWLRSQGKAPWGNTYVHPKAGPLSARLLLANWLAHDQLHVRQMLRVHREALLRDAAPDGLDYAGPW